MIDRTVLKTVEESIRLKPVTLITGARQVGKTILCKHIAEKHGFSYVSLIDRSERAMATKDPDMFLSIHKSPLIIDEVQYAPELLDSIEAIVDKAKYDTGHNEGMYILAGSQVYNLMDGVTQSMAGRISIIDMSPLSMNEILSRDETPFEVNFKENIRKSMEVSLSVEEVYKMVIRGNYPELYEKPSIKTNKFYSDYVDSYISRDVSQIINLKDQNKFMEFLELMSSLTGQELVYNNVAKTLGVNIRTIQSWTGVLVAGGIIRLIRAYSERSTVKRIVRHPKMYFCDTGLACYLAKIFDYRTLMAGYLKGPMIETFIVNEILKSYKNNSEEAGFFHYRDSQINEIDLIILRDGKLTPVECKAGITYGSSDIKAFARLENSDYEIGPSCLI
ncbi:MAG: DUF4143 domain-containing protein, partial [Bacilli bacterium]